MPDFILKPAVQGTNATKIIKPAYRPEKVIKPPLLGGGAAPPPPPVP